MGRGALALAAVLPLLATSAMAQRPHPDVDPRPPAADPHPPAREPARRSEPSFTPSLSLSFTFRPKPRSAEGRDEGAPDHVPDAVIFLLSDAGDPGRLAGLAGVTVSETVALESVRLTMVVASLQPGDTPEAAVGRLAVLPGVAWAQVDHIYQSLGPTRLPKSFELQGLTGAEMARPAPGVAAMIDTMVALDHEAFAGAAIQQRLFATSMTPGAHGTAAASLLVGRGDMPGTGRGARLVSLAAFQQPSPDRPALSQTRNLAKALDAAALLRPNVLNLSFGGPGDRLLETLITAIDARGVCIAAAAGNGGKAGKAPFPASHRSVLGVTAVDEHLRVYEFATPGRHVDVAAVGVDLTAAAPGGYQRVSGSSFATALVSGALLRMPDCAQLRNPAAMRAAVAAAAKDLGAPGRDEVFGAGLFRLPAPR